MKPDTENVNPAALPHPVLRALREYVRHKAKNPRLSDAACDRRIANMTRESAWEAYCWQRGILGSLTVEVAQAARSLQLTR